MKRIKRGRGGLAVMIIATFAALTGSCGTKTRSAYDLDGVHGSKKIKEHIKREILPWIKNPALVNAVKEANARNRNRSKEEINRLDQEWINATEKTKLIRFVEDNPASAFLKNLKDKSGGKYQEIFLMDIQGCNVAMTDRTSDFWQGDEAKFRRTYNRGKGSIFVDREKFDESANTRTVQVSLPIVDPAGGKIIGALTIGIDVKKL